MAEPQHIQLPRERRIGMIIRNDQADTLARADEVEAWAPLKWHVKAEVRTSMQPALRMPMGAVRMRRLEGTMLGGAPDGDRLPKRLRMIFTCVVDD